MSTVIEKLNKMIRSGEIYQYREDEIQFLNFSERDGMYRINVIRNKESQILEKESSAQLDNFLNMCKKIVFIEQDTEEVQSSGSEVPVIFKKQTRETFLPSLLEENKETFKSIAEMLMEDIKLVRKNKDYVPQAKQAANSAQVLVNMVKTQLEIIRHG
jgi:hypothetical protein